MIFFFPSPKCLFAEFVAQWVLLDFFSYYFLMSRNEIFCFYLNLFFFYSYLSASQPQIVTQDRGELKEKKEKEKKVFAASKHLHVWQRTIWGLQCFETKTHHLDPTCCAVVGFSFLLMVLACVDRSNEHVSPLSFAASNHCQRGSSARETSAQNKRRFGFPPSFWLFFLVFCFFFGLVLVGHKTSQSKGSFFDFMLDLFLLFCSLSLTLCDIDACMFVRLKKKKKNVGIRLFLWCFQLNCATMITMTNFAKTSTSEYLIWPSICPVCLM